MINVDARQPDDVYADPQSLVVEKNVAFLLTCVRQFPVLNFAHRDTDRIYARFECGRLAWKDQTAMDAIEDPVTLGALHAVAPDLFARAITSPMESEDYLDPACFLTLGR